MSRHIVLSLVAACALAAPVWAAENPDPPEPTETTTKCTGTQVWDEDKKACVSADQSGLHDDRLYQAAREIAWAGRPRDALAVLDAMAEGDTDRVLTYRGFSLRKAGQWEAGRASYHAALALNPDNLLARSYLGMGLLERGDFAAAFAQWEEIRARGGTGTWAETALLAALTTGQITEY
jgi:Flp pilus assembly protein TadD